ncbi:hypothetical protein Pint_26404 [Pistacia integerrima]|uniref:Uncharacterized protein n=1 Tax=Pistacia integerrima TaxID=434235 RepID=A0ACC0YGW9_9ROSI|nr:hypothetical protein Pint_26404 [Pistacia integerrima]
MEFVVEPLVSELFKGLFKILESTEVRDFAWNLVEVDSELKELKKKLLMVYDVEDILDEFAYEASRRKMKAEHQASSSKGMSCLHASFPSPLFNVRMGSKIKDITCRLEQLWQERSAKHEMHVVSGGTSSNVDAPERPEETSSVRPENFVYSRDENEAKLVEMAVKSAQPSGANFLVIAIVGLVPFKAGAPGSTIIITTRLENVASVIGAVPYPLNPISDDHC